LWPDFISDFAVKIRASSGVLTFHNVKERDLSFIKSFGRDESLFEEYREHFVNINPFLSIVSETPYVVFSSHMLIEENQLVKTEYYNGWLLP